MKDGSKGKKQLKKELMGAYQRVLEARNKCGPVRGDNADCRQGMSAVRHLRKMELVSQIGGALAQYFNNIFSVIIGYGSLLQTRLDEGDPLRPYVHQILASSERAALLTRSLLAFSRKQVINPKPVCINDVIRRAGRLIQRVIGDGIEFKTKLSRAELPVSADAVQLEQVMMNLATNARDAMPDGGTLTIETKMVEMTNKFLGRGPHAWKCVMITFSDTGTGMDAKTKERIFEPFYTTKEAGKATGLGLAVVYGIIKQHNGSINVTSDVGKGSKFSIYLPVLRANAMEGHMRVPLAMAKGSSYYS